MNDINKTSRPRRRRQRLKHTWDSSVKSPCIGVCRFADHGDHCLGCARTVDEIREWPILSREDKLNILANIDARKTAIMND